MKSALRLAMLALSLCGPAHANESLQAAPLESAPMQTGAIMICDTQKQVERYVTFLNVAGKPEFAIRAVNTEADNPSACAVANLAYIRGATIGIARTQSDAFEIVEILATAINTPAGMRTIRPTVFFTLVKIKEYAA